MHVLTVVGARPQFIKAAALSRVLQQRAAHGGRLRETLLHTGQHYDQGMSGVFFEELSIPAPAYNLNVGSGTHGETTGRMLAGIEAVLMQEHPDLVVVYGDTNSTLAGALAATKLHLPLAHVEAGLRSQNLKMPEEVNRVLTDRIADLLFCPTYTAVQNLHAEGLKRGCWMVGDIMYDAALLFAELARRQSVIIDRLQISRGEYYLVTIHRAENTDSHERFGALMQSLSLLSRNDLPVIWPVHPRVRRLLEEKAFRDLPARVRLIDPLPYLDMVKLEQNARIILTDSGGVQKEAYFHGVPCVTLRDETEWVETVEHGWNQVVGTDPSAILRAVANATPGSPIPDYGDGHTAEAIVDRLIAFHDAKD